MSDSSAGIKSVVVIVAMEGIALCPAQSCSILRISEH